MDRHSFRSCTANYLVWFKDFTPLLCVVDVLARAVTKKVLWKEQVGRASSAEHPIMFNGVPFVILGWQVLECSAGPARLTKQRQPDEVSVVI